MTDENKNKPVEIKIIKTEHVQFAFGFCILGCTSSYYEFIYIWLERCFKVDNVLIFLIFVSSFTSWTRTRSAILKSQSYLRFWCEPLYLTFKTKHQYNAPFQNNSSFSEQPDVWLMADHDISLRSKEENHTVSR